MEIVQIADTEDAEVIVISTWPDWLAPPCLWLCGGEGGPAGAPAGSRDSGFPREG